MVEGMAQFLGREVSSCLHGLYILPKFQRQTRLVLDWLQVLAAGLSPGYLVPAGQGDPRGEERSPAGLPALPPLPHGQGRQGAACRS